MSCLVDVLELLFDTSYEVLVGHSKVISLKLNGAMQTDIRELGTRTVRRYVPLVYVAISISFGQETWRPEL